MTASGHPATFLEETRCAQRADGTAAVLAIGTANPVNCVRQDEYADWHFRVTRSDHLATLKAKMKRICERSGVKKRHFHHTEEMIGGHPEFLDRAVPSLGARLGLATDAVQELAAVAAARAIAEWGRPVAEITHLVVSTNCVAGAPGIDLSMAALLGLRRAVHRTMLYLHGCSAGSVALRFAKDLAENNRGSRVLVICSEVVLLGFRAPDEAQLDALVAATLFGDGAGAAIVGAGPTSPAERPVFHMVSASQVMLPGTEHAVGLHLSERGIDFRMSVELPTLVRDSIEQCLADGLAPLGLASGGWNGLFWAAHPGGRAILDSYEAALGLEPGKLAASRRVLSEYGNMLGATIFFVLDEMRRCRRGGDEEQREDCEWGVMLVLGPGLTIETMVLHAAGCRDED
ncbi:bisdemethoxycurcumin synthase-like [Phragmites australis]|uniref:bisdemethoxycurcumin synthase-like n=1 Tax=Phragmites australis TaxID=29695 RepID=UPI002D78ACAF|nr:bisdemethoxycurcumin synthase-like [Phragmites australis]